MKYSFVTGPGAGRGVMCRLGRGSRWSGTMAQRNISRAGRRAGDLHNR